MWKYVDLTLGLVAISLLYRLSKRRKRLNLPLPPGPKGAPLVGNLLQMPTEFEWKKYHEWCKEYNTDVLYLNIAGTELIVLDTSQAATDLLETRSSLYSGRTRLPMINELMGWDFNIGFMPYGALYDSSYGTELRAHAYFAGCSGLPWRKHRRLLHHSFHPLAAMQYRPHIMKATLNLLKRFLDDPNPLKIIPHLRHMAGETILSIAYGIEIQQKNDPYLETSEAGVLPLVVAGVPGAFLVDSIPLLKYVPAWFPGASFQRKAREWRKLSRTMIEMPYAEAKKDIESGKANVSLVSTNLQKIQGGTEDEAFTEEIVKNVAGTLFAAGSDTTVSAITSCILGLLEHPEVLKKAQAQIDAVVKPGHLPGFEDEPSLPYVTAIAKETLRWRDVVPIAVWLAIASLVATFDIEKAKEKVTVVGKDGIEREEEKTVELTHEYISALVITPKPFKCAIKPRSKEKADLIRATLIQDYD
ncbi:hypothetical protein EST38_g10494 [Candolleomyces aberdarensis]|uniref:Cytochrome P450 n=1 Tax=Candolleomyces aberdarensis TaxID=2316362 RepID=A0A4V1Q2K0_9AGAR|nr:hypothetical protein EST38_g10494 [Candolleomyces aberdarensis]